MRIVVVWYFVEVRVYFVEVKLYSNFKTLRG
jgi:hypothetical protein